MRRRRLLPGWTCLGLIGIVICLTSEAANGQGHKRERSSETSSRIVAGTLVDGDIDLRTLRAALEALPRRPERIVVVDTESLPLGHERQWRDLDAYVPIGARVIYLRRQSQTMVAAEYRVGLTC